MISIQYNIRSLSVRKTTTLATALGMGLVVFVFAASLMLSAGIKQTLQTSGSADVALVMRKGSDAELGSVIETQQTALVTAMPGVKADASGPLVSPEVVLVLALEKLGADGVTNVQLRGVTERARALRPALRIVEGREPKSGSDEVMVGQRIRGRFRGVDLGQSFEVKANRPANVVGVFADGGSSYESEIWGDIDSVRSAFGRDGMVSSVRARLESAEKFDGFAAAAGQDKRLGLEATRETVYFEKQSEGTSLFISIVGVLIAVFFSFGAMIGAAITMYSAVANRRREIGILRALGFPGRTVLLSFVIESMLLSAVGGAMGVMGASLLGAVEFSMMNFASWSEIVFKFEPTPSILGASFLFALGMGLLGGFFPALTAARTSPLVAMRG